MTVKGKTVLITGSTDGVGRLSPSELRGGVARAVIVHGRDRARGERSSSADRAQGGDAPPSCVADLSSLAEVRSSPKQSSATRAVWTLLVNNAGIGTSKGGGRELKRRRASSCRFAVNYLCGLSVDAAALAAC